MLDVERMLQHKPFWRKPFSHTLKKKVLIINDPALATWNNEECIVAAEQFKSLQDKGFNLYFYHTAKLVALDTSLLEFPDQLVDAKSIADKELSEKAVKQLQLSHDEILILNHQEITKLLQNIDEEWLSPTSLEKYNFQASNINGATLSEFLKTSGNQIKSLNLSRCVNFKAAIPPESLSLDKLEELIIENADSKKTHILALGKEFYSRVNNLPSSFIQQILIFAPNLKILALSFCNNINDLINSVNFALIEELDLSNTDISIESLDKILAKAPKLKKLKLSSCKNLGSDLKTKHNLAFLEELDLSESNISSVSLDKLLINAHKLKKLNLSNCPRLVSDFPTEFNPAFLEELDLGLSKISSQSLNKILAKASRLKKLLLGWYKNYDSNFLAGLNPTFLEELELFPHKNQSLNVLPLGNFLAKASNLKELKLSSHREFEFDWPDFNPASLETLELYRVNNSNKTLSKLLTQMPKLKKLQLSVGSGLMAKLSLPSLEVFTVHSSNLNIQFLREIFTAAVNIKSIILSYCSMVNREEDIPKDLNFSSLQTLDLSSCSISPEMIKKIQSRASHISVIPPNIFQQSQRIQFPQGQYGREVLDADTQWEPNKKFVLDRIFYASDNSKHPAPDHYRQQIYNQFTLNNKPCTAQTAFTLGNTSSDLVIEESIIPRSATDLKAKLPAFSKGHRYYYGFETINLSKEWQPLASLAPDEVMTQYHLSEEVDVEIGYSKRDNLYCIRRKPGTFSKVNSISIDFILKIPPLSQEKLPLDVLEIIKECRNFGIGSLQVKSETTGEDYLNALKTQKVGACRHRSLVFKATMDKRKPYLPTRIVNNECHSYAEVYYNNHWICCDLGGYPAELIINEQNQAAPVIQQLTAAGSIQNKKSYFAHAIEDKNKAPTIPLYMEHLLSLSGHKKLIQVESDKALHGIRYHLQKYCHSTSRPCFYIHSPEDLICSAPYIHRQGSQGTTKKGPGGSLHDFLMQHSKNGSKPVLIVNYDKFSASDIVRFNTLLDKERFADGSPVPLAAQVIGLMNPGKPGAYDGVDFRSRFDAIIPNIASNIQLSIPSCTQQLAFTPESESINLYGGKDWEDRLLGHWVLKGNQLRFIDGELLVALKNKRNHIALKNAPWDDERFQAFWQKALLTGSFHVHGVDYEIPKEFKLSKAEGYSFEKKSKHIKINEEHHLPPDTLVLNSTLLAGFFAKYRFNNKNSEIHYEEGILARYHKKTINLYLSDALDIPSWAEFLDACQQHEVMVNLHIAPGVTVPEQLGLNAIPKAPVPAATWPVNIIPATACIHSSDMDITLGQLAEGALIIDVSEVSWSDLLMKLDGSFDKDALAFRFQEQQGALLRALNDKKTIVLKGTIKEELRHVLSEFLIQRQQEAAPKGQLLIVSEQPHLFPMLPTWKHEVSPAEKKKQVRHNFPEKFYSQHKLSTLQAMASYLALHPEEAGENAWQGMYKLPPTPPVEKIELGNAAKMVLSFNQQRLSAVEQVLKQAPFAFLAGVTGVGKTTFIHELWKKKHSKVYVNESSKLAWAKDRSAGIKTLFIDEANISSRHWSEFEGLFNQPPRILIGNELIELTKEHKVIFAGNPLSYGGERHLPSLFERHGNSIVFTPLPPACLYEEIIKPIFTPAQLNSEALALPILEVAQYCNNLDGKQIRITPREQGMMALLTVSYCQKYPGADALKVAQYYAYTLAERFVPKENRWQFEEQFKKVQRLPHVALKLFNDFQINTHNQPAYDALCDLLSLRALRQNKGIQAEGGLGGLVIEGDPGLGKSELVIATLVAYGLKKGDLNKEHPNESVFYLIPVSMSYDEKATVLLKAFHEGAVVVMDEINSAPMMERLLNDLLMGKDPKGNTAKKPGFMLLGMQNPATMAGRKRASTALEHRMQQVTISGYSPEEMMAILVSKGLPEQISQEMVDDYLYVRQKSMQNLCFRDLVRQAELELTAKRIEPFLKLLHHLEKKQNDYQDLHQGAYEQAEMLLGQLKVKAKAFYGKSNFSDNAVNLFKTECIRAIKQNSSVLREHRAFMGELLAVIHQFFIALKAFILNKETTHRFFDSRSSGAKVADELVVNISNFSI